MRGGPEGWMISSRLKSRTTSAVAFFIALASGQPVRCSTATSTYRFPFDDLGNGPAKSIENTSNRLVIGGCNVVRYFGFGVASWQLLT